MLVTRKLFQSMEQGTEGVTRSLDFTLAKLMEELGELAVEVQIAQGHLPKDKGGVDGVLGEVFDVVAVALDIAYIHQCQVEGELIEPYKVEQLLLCTSSKKMQRWQEKQRQIEAMQICEE